MVISLKMSRFCNRTLAAVFSVVMQPSSPQTKNSHDGDQKDLENSRFYW